MFFGAVFCNERGIVMKSLDVHGKQLPVPSFFQVYNYGGGNGDKDREIVYSEFTGDTPALLNYFYINNKYPHSFSSKLFDEVYNYNTVGDLYNYIRKKLIEKGEIYNDYESVEYDFNKKVFLLDSGAANIVKQIAKEIRYDPSKLKAVLVEHMKEYYDFADSLKMDIVVGFDLGGKYTKKDGEEGNKELVEFLISLDTNDINNFLLEETIKYISQKDNYYPYVLATVHGRTRKDYSNCVDFILKIEKEYNYKFWGFALGGIASYKQVDSDWLDGVNFTGLRKNDFAPIVSPARACKIVRAKVLDRPIHALGCGGYPNIATNYFCGATSFDAASPVRRVGDGSGKSAEFVFTNKHYAKNKIGFSQYFVGGINTDDMLRPAAAKYININEVPNDLVMCGCPACEAAKNILNIKQIYAKKVNGDKEAFFYSRQLMGLHAVFQHRKLCEVIAKYPDIESFCQAYQSELNKGLIKVYNQL